MRESFTPCCVRSRPKPLNCCACSEVYQFYKLKPEHTAADTSCVTGFGGVFTRTAGCGNLDSDWLTTVGFNYTFPFPQLNCAMQWTSFYYLHPAFGGPDPSELPGIADQCCFAGGFGECGKPIYWNMACQNGASSGFWTEQTSHWEGEGLYCVECEDNIWIGDDEIEYYSLEDCQAANGVDGCACAYPGSPVWHNSLEDCESYGCTGCHEVIDTVGFWTPPTPQRWFLGFNGPCGCTAVYISTTSDDPIYGFYQPTSGYDQVDPCGNFYYQHFGALDATGPFSCTSGGRFTLVNLIQPAYLGGDCSIPIPPENLPTNLFMGYDAACAVGWLGGGCRYGCTDLPIYVDVEPIDNLRKLPNSNWFPNLNDPTGNMFCCPSSGSTSNPFDIIDMEALSVPMNEAIGEKLYFTWGIFQGEVVREDESNWYVNYPPIKWQLTKTDDDYYLDGVKMLKVNDYPLMLELKVKNQLLEITQ